ncbi:transglutaminase family protein [Parasphingorhabdus pacifica]
MIPRTGRTFNVSVITTLAAALSVLLTSAALMGVVADFRWVPPSMLTIGLVAGVGVLGRRYRWWSALTVLAQLTAVLYLLGVVYSGEALLGVLPGPSAVVELTGVVTEAFGSLRDGTPPVATDAGLRCLLALGLGLVAVLVDAIAVSAGVPAVAGLVLLCVFAVPASMADQLLPWGAFVSGAAGFALLLTSGGQHRRWSGREPREAVVRTLLGSHGAAVTATAVVFALIMGAAFTGVGTEGRLPGSSRDDDGSATGGIGLRPFTSLRGQLNRDQSVDLFRVRGLPHDTYLRAMTLRKFEPERGWQLEGLTKGVGTGADLPLPEGTDRVQGDPARVRIEPIGYRDPWLPVFGIPTNVSGMGADWRYDPAAGIVFTQTPQASKPYTEDLILPDPTPEQLRHARGPVDVDPAYLDIRGIPPKIIDLAERLTSDDSTKFDQAVSLTRYFTDPANGFVYDLNTAPPAGGGALSDFLFRGKRGFCEQYASSLAVLLRSVGIPSRVAVGFTSGSQEGNERIITTNDAHAWVEAYFPGYGWTTFDPTPLDDGRGARPAPGEEAAPEQPTPSNGAEPGPAPERSAGDPDAGSANGGSGTGLLGPAVALLVLLLAVSLGPIGMRELRRRRRLHAVTEGAPGAAGTAWHEVLDESHDRGNRPSASTTARKAAEGIVERHGLDESGATAIRALVGAVEQEWYGPPGVSSGIDLPNVLHEIVGSLRRHEPLDWRARLLPRSVVDLGDNRP